MSKVVELIFDCGSPNAYLIQKVLPGVAMRAGASVKITPCLLGGIFKATGNQPPMVAFADIKGKSEYERLEFNRFIEKHQLHKFTFNPHFPINTLLCMRGAIHADREGFLNAYVDIILHHMWEKPKQMDDPEVFAEALLASGLDGRAILAATQDADVKDGLLKNTQHAVERGVFGIPTYFVGQEMFYGKERLGQLEEYLKGLPG